MSTKQSQKSVKRGAVFSQNKTILGKDSRLSYSLLKNSIGQSTISKKISPKILDSQIKTNFYEKSIYKSQLEKKVSSSIHDQIKKKSSKAQTLKSFYSKIDNFLNFRKTCKTFISSYKTRKKSKKYISSTIF